MLRIAASRLAPTRLPSRTISTSSPLFVRIRSSAPGGSNPNPDSNSSGKQPSPAEAPPSVPDDITSGKPFEPVVNQSQAAPVQTASSETQTTPSDSPNTPLTPPSPSSSAKPSSSRPTASSSKTPSQNQASTQASTPSLNPDPTVETTPEQEQPFDRSKLVLPSLDIDPEAALPEPKPENESEGAGTGGRGSGRTGAGRKEYVSSIERQRRMLTRAGLGVLALGALGGAWYAASGEPTVAPDGTQVSQYQTFKNNLSEFFDVFNKPAFKTLLPDPLPAPHQRPYTLVIDLEGLLVSSTWDRANGWRTAKRPGVDYFLAYLSQFYEIVLFTSQPLYTAMPVAEKLDPFTAYLPYRLYRESTRTVNGKVVKDLSYLNRDLSKVIMLDTNGEHAGLQPENAIIIKPWEGKGGDRGLVDLIPFLESIGIFNPPDVRPILKAYEGKDIPTEYAKKEAEAKRIAVEEWERLHPARAVGGFSLGGMFGSVAQSGQSRPSQPMTYLEQKREQAQKAYQEEQKYWAEHAEEFKKMIEEDKQKQLAEMKGSLLGYISGQNGPAKPEEKK